MAPACRIFVKQVGAWVASGRSMGTRKKYPKGGDIDQWPEDLHSAADARRCGMTLQNGGLHYSLQAPLAGWGRGKRSRQNSPAGGRAQGRSAGRVLSKRFWRRHSVTWWS